MRFNLKPKKKGCLYVWDWKNRYEIKCCIGRESREMGINHKVICFNRTTKCHFSVADIFRRLYLVEIKCTASALFGKMSRVHTSNEPDNQTHSIVQSSYPEAESYSASQQILCTLRNSEFHYDVHVSLPLVLVLSQANSVLNFNLFTLTYNLILSRHLRLKPSKHLHSFRLG